MIKFEFFMETNIYYERLLPLRPESLKTQRSLSNFNHTFIIAPVGYNYKKAGAIIRPMPGWIRKLFGLKEKPCREDKSGLKKLCAYFFLLISLTLNSFYAINLNFVPGNFITRIMLRYAFGIVFFIPVVYIELSRKIEKGELRLWESLRIGTLLRSLRNAIYFTCWNLCFSLSLKYTELSTAIVYSNLLLLFTAFYKIFFKGSSGTSEFEIRGAIWSLLGVLLFLIKNLTLGTGPFHRTTLFEYKSYTGELLCLLASISSAMFFQNNKDIQLSIPRYTNIVLTLIWSFFLTLLCEFCYKGWEGYQNYEKMSVQVILEQFQDFDLPVMVRYCLFGLLTTYGTFGFQNFLLRNFEPFLLNCVLIFEPLFSIFLGTLFQIQDLEVTTLFLVGFFTLPGKLLTLIGMQQFEERYEGGEIGIPKAMRDDMRIEHLEKLEMMGLRSNFDTIELQNIKK